LLRIGVAQIAVGKKMFAWGAHRGCILVQDKHDGQIHVIKKSFDSNEAVENVYNAVKIEAIADLMAQCYNANDPPRKVVFVPCFIYILAQRPLQPAVRVEPLIFNHDKARLRNIPDVSQEELDTLEAFELFSYLESEKSFVVTNPCRVGEFWTEPEFHSLEGHLGGEKNRGVKGINVFLLRHQYNEICRMMGLKNPASIFDEARTRLQLQQEEEARARQLKLGASANTDSIRKIVEGDSDVAQLPPSLLSVSLPPRFPYYPREEVEVEEEPAPVQQEVLPEPQFPVVRPGILTSLTLEENTLLAQEVVASEPKTKGKGRVASTSSTKGLSGVLINQQQSKHGGYFFIEEVVRAGPAERSGVREGDILLGVDGITIAGKSQAQVEALLKGYHGTTVIHIYIITLLTLRTNSRATQSTHEPH
jgi:hypothetical protein